MATDRSEFPKGLEYIADDPLAETYLNLAARARVLIATVDGEDPDFAEDVHEINRTAVAAGIPSGRLGLISSLAISQAAAARNWPEQETWLVSHNVSRQGDHTIDIGVQPPLRPRQVADLRCTWPNWAKLFRGACVYAFAETERDGQPASLVKVSAPALREPVSREEALARAELIVRIGGNLNAEPHVLAGPA